MILIDFNLSSYVLGSADFTSVSKVKFGGPHGIPLYIIGPNENSRKIITKLERKLGKDGFEIYDPRD